MNELSFMEFNSRYYPLLSSVTVNRNIDCIYEVSGYSIGAAALFKKAIRRMLRCLAGLPLKQCGKALPVLRWDGDAALAEAVAAGMTAR